MYSRQQDTLSITTDTATPQTPIPIFYIHNGAHPFCKQPSCICHVNEEGLRKLLVGVIAGELKLRETYNGVLAGGRIQ